MNKIAKIILVSLLLLLLIPCAVYASQNNLENNRTIILTDKEITGEVKGNIIVLYGTADIKTDINGSLIVVFGKASVEGKVNGDVVSVLGELNISENSDIRGNLVSLGKIVNSDSITVSGIKFAVNFDLISIFKSNGIIINTLILHAFLVLVEGLILIRCFTARYRVMADSMGSRTSRRMTLGILVVISMTIILAFFIFFAAVPIVYVLMTMFSDIVAAIYVGTLILKSGHEKSIVYLQFFLGHLLISILKIVPVILLPTNSYVPLMIYGIGYLLLEAAITAFGMGTVIDTSYGKN